MCWTVYGREPNGTQVRSLWHPEKGEPLMGQRERHGLGTAEEGLAPLLGVRPHIWSFGHAGSKIRVFLS